jgi:hypothetical protein
MDDNDITVPTSNVANNRWTIKSYCTHALEHIVHQKLAGGVFQLPKKHAIANSDATQIFVMDGIPGNQQTANNATATSRTGGWSPGHVHTYVRHPN